MHLFTIEIPFVNLRNTCLPVIIILCFFSLFASSQNISKKGSAIFKDKMMSENPANVSRFLIVVKNQHSFLQFVASKKLDIRVLKEYEPANIFLIESKWDFVNKNILTSDNVTFIDEQRIPKEELQVNGFDLSANKINVVHNNTPLLNGDNIVVSIKENKMDTTDIDFKGRFQSTTFPSPLVSIHASIMTTMIAGGGNSYYEGKGVAWGAAITSSDFSVLLPDADAAYQQYKISVQNHSYGTGIENFYGADAAAYDVSTINNPSLLHIFSAGNSGNVTPTNGIYAGVRNSANITGSFKMAKNIITAGATDSFGVTAFLSSRGPAYDGRVKPELVAFGIDGSSGAAALVSGVAILLQQQYKLLNNSMPANAMIKAILINSADDVGNKEVDYTNGYGSLNAATATKTLQQGRVFNGSVANAGTQSFNVAVPSGIKKLKLTLVWNDPPAVANALKALVNDLDLELMFTSSGEVWKPWVLNKFPHVDSLQQLPVRKKDSLNNIEQITLENPVPGNYKFVVKGFNVTNASQAFYVAYQFDSSDIFEWNFPTASDFVFPSSYNTLRWNSTFSTGIGKLEYSTDNGINWQLIENQVNLSDKFYKWNTPSITTNASLKMTIGGNQFISNLFPISARTLTGVGFNCPDSFLFSWKKNPQVNNYWVYSLGNKYLEPVLISSDSFVVFQKRTHPSLYYSVAPLIGIKEGVKSYTINYNLQGVGCYFRSFLSLLVNNNTAQLTLTLGTVYNITGIVLEKFNGINFQQLKRIVNINSLVILFNDSNLTKGLNIYRIRLELAGGGVAYSEPETVYYFAKSNYIVYPNPASHANEINVGVKNVDLAKMEIYNAIGIKVFEKIIDDRVNKIPAGRFRTGVYFMKISNNGITEDLFKLVVY